MVSRSMKKSCFYIVIGCMFFFITYSVYKPCSPSAASVILAAKQFVLGDNSYTYSYNRSLPIIFIGGMPRSGTTLLRVMLDAHPDIRCGEETRVIPRILSMRQQWMKSSMESKRLQEAGITSVVLDNAIASFVLEIIVGHGKPASRLCNKDPFTLRTAVYLHSLFPMAKFILLIRDGRAVVHSIITRKVTITGFDISDYRQCLTKWNSAMSAMYSQCLALGPSLCMPLHYEQLILHPKYWMEKVLQFLEVSWNETVLHHEKLVDKPGGISISKLERSSDQVIKPINIEALSKWVGHLPTDVVRDMANIAPMLATLGYNPNENPPNYGKPDNFVLQNTYVIKENQQVWAARELELQKERDKIRKKVYESKKAQAKLENNKTVNFSKLYT